MSHLTHHYQPQIIYMLTAVTCRREKIFLQPDYAQAAHEDIAPAKARPYGGSAHRKGAGVVEG